MNRMERVLVRLDEGPWHAVSRAAIGFAVIPVWLIVFGARPPGSTLVPFFLGVLFTLRVGPLIVRRALPVSAGVREAWAARRETAKKYDSYQWQKLFWVGLGVAAYALVSRERRAAVVALALVCLIAGAGGLAVWYRRKR